VRSRPVLLALQLVFVALVVGYAASALVEQWGALQRYASELRPRWILVALSGLIVLAAYALLVAIWRAMLGAWGASLSFVEASHVWFVSNLGKYVPGKVWQIAAMGAMAQQRGVPAVAAAGSALVVNLANIVSGFAIVLVTGAGVLGAAHPSGPRVAAVVVVLVLAGLLSLPVLLPTLGRLASLVLRRELEVPRIPARAIWLATLGTALAWVLYGLAFHLLALAFGVAPTAGSTGEWPGYVAVYTSSYLIGYLSLLTPGGIVVRETMLVEGLVALGLAAEPAGWLLAFASRLWLTVLEIAPGMLFLARGSLRRPSSLPNDRTTS
jgi:glycosyltransferase 2 family protein